MNTRRQKSTLVIGIVLATTVFAGEFRADEKAKKTEEKIHLKLSHKTHLEFIEKLEGTKKDCTDCHVLDEATDTYSVNKTICKRCHIANTPRPWSPPVSALRLKGVDFKHTDHTKIESSRRKWADEVHCIECHETTMTDAQKENELFVSPPSCVSCHSREKLALPEKNCAKCHEKKNKNRIEPENHKKNWQVHHGRAKRWTVASDHGKRCDLCHSRASCVSCHRTKRPRNHTGLWRMRMHGTAAKWDRQRCKTCHETGACVSCHRRTPPVTHRGAWETLHGRAMGPETNERCSTCHSPGWCRACHSGKR